MATVRTPRDGADDRAIALTTLRALFGALTQSARGIESRTGITNAQLFLLRQLTTADPLSINQLAARAHTRQNTVSSVVGRLVGAGLVESTRASDDARRAALSLTAKGRRMLARAPASPTEMLIAGIDSLSRRDARALADGLRALVDALDLAPWTMHRCFSSVQGGETFSGGSHAGTQEYRGNLHSICTGIGGVSQAGAAGDPAGAGGAATSAASCAGAANGSATAERWVCHGFTRRR